jgi:regulator of nucleoside diphosphate kinase
MTERQIKHIVSRAVGTAQPIPEKYYHLCWWEEQVQCHHVRHTRDAHEIFYSATGNIFLDGLSFTQWRLVMTRIAEFCNSRGIVLDSQSGRWKDTDAYRVARRQITEFDSVRLYGLLNSAQTLGFGSDASLDKLEEVLKSADVVKPDHVSDDVVTMNSQVRLRNDDAGIEATLSLVFPANGHGDDSEKPKLSVLTGTGLSILGRRAGDQVEGRLRILDVPYQPEAAGNFNL